VARERWEQRVGLWRSLTLVPGELIVRETKMWAGQSVVEREEMEAEERTSLDGAVPCTPDAQEQRCVRLVIETVPVRPYKASESMPARSGIQARTLALRPNFSRRSGQAVEVHEGRRQTAFRTGVKGALP